MSTAPLSPQGVELSLLRYQPEKVAAGQALYAECTYRASAEQLASLPAAAREVLLRHVVKPGRPDDTCALQVLADSWDGIVAAVSKELIDWQNRRQSVKEEEQIEADMAAWLAQRGASCAPDQIAARAVAECAEIFTKTLAEKLRPADVVLTDRSESWRLLRIKPRRNASASALDLCLRVRTIADEVAPSCLRMSVDICRVRLQHEDDVARLPYTAVVASIDSALGAATCFIFRCE